MNDRTIFLGGFFSSNDVSRATSGRKRIFEMATSATLLGNKTSSKDNANDMRTKKYVKEVNKQVDEYWKGLIDSTQALHEDKLTTLELQRHLELVESEACAAKDSEYLARVMNLTAKRIVGDSEVKGEEVSGERKAEVTSYVTKDVFLNNIRKDGFNRKFWRVATDRLFDRIASKGTDTEMVYANTFLEMLKKQHDDSTREDIRDLFVDMLGVSHDEYAFSELKMNRDLFYKMICKDFGEVLDKPGVLEQICGHLKPTPDGAAYDVRYDPTTKRYVANAAP